MKALKKILYIIPLLSMMATSCTDVENIEIDHIGMPTCVNIKQPPITMVVP